MTNLHFGINQLFPLLGLNLISTFYLQQHFMSTTYAIDKFVLPIRKLSGKSLVYSSIRLQYISNKVHSFRFLLCFCFVCLRLVYTMLPVSQDCFCFVCLVYTRRKQTKQKQSWDTGNILYTRRRQTKQKQSWDTGNTSLVFSNVYFIKFGYCTWYILSLIYVTLAMVIMCHY
jgi:hypothetical protein